MPAAEQCLGDAVGAFEERDVIHKVDHRPMGDIEPVAPSIGSSVVGVLIGGVHIARGIVATIALAKRLAVSVRKAHSQAGAVAPL